MGLDYLQKKNWHPGSMRNREEVWLREQLQKEIMKKELERAKKLQEEKHNEELKKLQVEAGLIPKSHLERMEWMYEWGNKLSSQQKTSDEYLLGKPVTLTEAEKLQQKSRSPLPPVFKEEVTNAKCEDFSKIHEDPIFFIVSGEQKMKQEFYSNPLRVKQTMETLSNQTKTIQKTEKKEKKHKKEKKEKKNKKEKKEKKSKKEKKEKRRRSRS